MSKTKAPTQIELLAPVGKWDVLEAVIAAGADAVYLGGKKYNMRLHQKECNFTEEELQKVVAYSHEQNVKVYVTVNNLLANSEINVLSKYLTFLQEISVDGIIIQDLSIVYLARKLGLTIPLHASVMMNVHNLEGLQLLEELGISRVILGRELALDEIKLLHSKTQLELEYFTHGDMCFCQSSQCYHSGMLFGQSSNRGRCLKPCRWEFNLVDQKTRELLPVQVPGPYYLAIKDICLLPFLPEVIESGICSLKIEGRMRPAEFLAPLIGFYRHALDSYYADPIGYTFDWDQFSELNEMRVRDFSTLYAFGNPGPEAIGYTGEREPRFFSHAVKEPVITTENLKSSPLPNPKQEKGFAKPALTVKAGSKAAAISALESGADLVYTSGESFFSYGKPWGWEDFPEVVACARELGKKIVIGLPRITMPEEMEKTLVFLEKIKKLNPDGILVTNLGTIYAAAKNTSLPLYADYSCNLANEEAAAVLKDYRTVQLTAPLEFCYEEILALPGGPLAVEAVIHGHLPAMVTDHCLPAALIEYTTKYQICGGLCQRRQYGLQDTAGQVHPLAVDQNCRNHLYMANELALIPYLRSFYGAGFDSLRLEIPLYSAEEAAAITRLYREEIDRLWGEPENYSFQESIWQELLKIRKGPFGTGPYTSGVKLKNND